MDVQIEYLWIIFFGRLCDIHCNNNAYLFEIYACQKGNEKKIYLACLYVDYCDVWNYLGFCFYSIWNFAL